MLLILDGLRFICEINFCEFLAGRRQGAVSGSFDYENDVTEGAQCSAWIEREREKTKSQSGAKSPEDVDKEKAISLTKAEQ